METEKSLCALYKLFKVEDISHYAIISFRMREFLEVSLSIFMAKNTLSAVNVIMESLGSNLDWCSISEKGKL